LQGWIVYVVIIWFLLQLSCYKQLWGNQAGAYVSKSCDWLYLQHYYQCQHVSCCMCSMLIMLYVGNAGFYNTDNSVVLESMSVTCCPFYKVHY
jgi:hypothetical protein